MLLLLSYARLCQVLSQPIRFDNMRLHDTGDDDIYRMVCEIRCVGRRRLLVRPRDDNTSYKFHILAKLVPALTRPIREPLPRFPSDHISSLQVGSSLACCTHD